MGRTNIQCFTTYHCIKPSELRVVLQQGGGNESFTVRGVKSRQVWTDAEDAQLRELHARCGNDWRLIGDLLGRPNTHCFQRWQILSARRGPTGWTDEQKEELLRLVDTLGHKWTRIGGLLGRSAYVCSSAYKRLSKSSLLSSGSSAHEAATIELITSVRPWSKLEDEMLKRLVGKYGRQWPEIAENMGRSPEDIMLRHDFKIAVRRWTKQDDKKLVELVQLLGRKWAQISVILDRSEAQCAVRYSLQLDPRLKFKLWSREEDERLLSLKDELRYNFGMISAILDRTGPSCRYRYNVLHKSRLVGNQTRQRP